MTAAQNQEILIAELTELYSKDFEKLIQKIFNNDWILDVFTDEYFTIRNNNCYPIKVDFDEKGCITIDPFNIFGYSPISFDYNSDIDVLKAIIKLYENKDSINEFLCKFMQSLLPMNESYKILKKWGK
jgi:hypothetical protein